MASPDLMAPEMSSVGIAWVVTSQLGDVLGRIVLGVVAISIFSAALAIAASATRVMFSMARDGRLPFSRVLAHVSPRTKTPIWSGITVGVLSIAVLLINLGQTSVFTSVTSISVVIVYLAYLFVTVPRLWHRLRRSARHEADPAYFSLGRWGLPVNIVAVVFGVFLLVNIGWPRQGVYDPDGSSADWVPRVASRAPAPLTVSDSGAMPSPSVVAESCGSARPSLPSIPTVTPGCGAPVRRSVTQVRSWVPSSTASTPRTVDCAQVDTGLFW